MSLLLTDADLPRALSMGEAIKAVRAALRERAAGTAHGMPRATVSGGPGRIVLTPGGLDKQKRVGLRVYGVGYPRDVQLTAVWDTETGELDGLVSGPGLGVLRTGAIGGCAFQLLAPAKVTKVALVGAGPQARAQLEALLAVREVDWVEVIRRDTAELPATAAALRDALGVSVTPASNVEAAVRGADVVITATGSGQPVLDPDWVQPGAHVSCLGPKRRDRSELDLELVRKADLVASDYPEQLDSDPRFLLQGTPEQKKLQDLARLMAGTLTREEQDLTLFLSCGLAGTEVAVAAAALARARALGLGTELPELGG